MEKYVITGSASCGKTSVINEIRRRGYSVLEETAWEVIEDRLDQELTPKEFVKRQELIFQRQLRRESYEFGNQPVFQDRSLIDCLAYCKLYLPGTPKEIKDFNYQNRYSNIFILDPLPLKPNPIRIEKSQEDIDKVHEALIQTYSGEGYQLIPVPVVPLEQRVDYILERLKNV